MFNEIVLIKEVETCHDSIKRYARVIKNDGVKIVGETVPIFRLSKEQLKKAQLI